MKSGMCETSFNRAKKGVSPQKYNFPQEGPRLTRWHAQLCCFSIMISGCNNPYLISTHFRRNWAEILSLAHDAILLFTKRPLLMETDPQVPSVRFQLWPRNTPYQINLNQHSERNSHNWDLKARFFRAFRAEVGIYWTSYEIFVREPYLSVDNESGDGDCIS